MLPVLLQAQIQKFLDNNLGPSGRGFTTLEIKKAINTSFTTRQLSEILKSLVKLKILYFTGNTKGKRFVLGEYAKIALANFKIDCKTTSLCYQYDNVRRWGHIYPNNNNSILFEKLKEKRMSMKKYCQSLPDFQKLSIESNDAYREGKRKANYNLNPYLPESENHIAFNQGVCGVLDHSNV